MPDPIDFNAIVSDFAEAQKKALKNEDKKKPVHDEEEEGEYCTIHGRLNCWKCARFEDYDADAEAKG